MTRPTGNDEPEYLSGGRAAEQSARVNARRMQVLLVVLAVMLIGWWQQDWLKAQYQWRVVMKPAVLTPEQETHNCPEERVPRMRARLPDDGRGASGVLHHGLT